MVPSHSFGVEVASIVRSYARCRYSTGLGSAVWSNVKLTEVSRSASSAQKWRISLDHSLRESAFRPFRAHVIAYHLRGVTLGLGSPCSNAIIGSYEIVSCQNSVVAIRDAPNHLPLNIGPSVPAPIMRTQRVRERTRGRRQKRRRERP